MKTLTKTVALLGAMGLLWPEVAWACEMCFGAAGDETAGISMAMLALLGMTGLVWGGIGMFFINMRKRARLLEPGDLIVTEDGEILDRLPDTP
jgi:hypothetical protein